MLVACLVDGVGWAVVFVLPQLLRGAACQYIAVWIVVCHAG